MADNNDNNARPDQAMLGVPVGEWAKMALNGLAILVVCYLLYLSQHNFFTIHNRTVDMFSNEMTKLREEMSRDRQHDREMRDITNSLTRDLQKSIIEQQANLQKSLTAMTALADEIRMLRVDKNKKQ